MTTSDPMASPYGPLHALPRGATDPIPEYHKRSKHMYMIAPVRTVCGKAHEWTKSWPLLGEPAACWPSGSDHFIDVRKIASDYTSIRLCGHCGTAQQQPAPVCYRCRAPIAPGVNLKHFRKFFADIGHSHPKLDFLYNVTTINQARAYIGTCDIMLFQGGSSFSKGIMAVTRSIYSHAALFIRTPPADALASNPSLARTWAATKNAFHVEHTDSDVWVLEANTGRDLELIPLDRWMYDVHKDHDDYGYGPDAFYVWRRLCGPPDALRKVATCERVLSKLIQISHLPFEQFIVELFGAVASNRFRVNLNAPFRSSSGEQLFCSEMAAHVLKAAGIIHPHVVECNVVPSSLASDQHPRGDMVVPAPYWYAREVRLRLTAPPNAPPSCYGPPILVPAGTPPQQRPPYPIPGTQPFTDSPPQLPYTYIAPTPKALALKAERVAESVAAGKPVPADLAATVSNGTVTPDALTGMGTSSATALGGWGNAYGTGIPPPPKAPTYFHGATTFGARGSVAPTVFPFGSVVYGGTGAACNPCVLI